MMATMAKRRERRNITCSKAAEMLGDVGAATVRKWCRLGLVGETDPVTGWYMLTDTEVRRMGNPENRPQAGRPPSDP